MPSIIRLLGSFKRISGYSDLIIAALVIGIVMIIVIPIPPALLDVLLSFSLAASLVIILTTLFVDNPLQFSVFPTLLLIVTLLRLSLNISSTRMILGTGAAGQVIQAFGQFVAGGNMVVGFVVFLIITIIQFVVITNGSGRVAEVAARFTLDAMPGKQMSIDADLNAGLIDEGEARSKRSELAREADFYGAMDGASKFVRGDAIAGIIITLVNLIGGIVIGTLQLGMPFSDALQRFALLTVGDGLVSQLPALLVSTATGILVTRTGSGEGFGVQLTGQLSAFPRVIALAAVLLALLGIVPGLPNLPFLILAAGTGYLSYNMFRQTRSQKQRVQEQEAAATRPHQPENVLNLFDVDPLEIEIGYNLIPLTDEGRGGDLLERLAAVRRQCATEMGVYVRPIRVRDNLQLEPNAYRFKVRGVEAARGELRPGQYLAMNPAGDMEPSGGLATREPTFGLKAWWVSSQMRSELELQGFTVVDASTVLVTHLTEFIRGHSYELLGRQEVKELLDTVREKNPAVIEELVPEPLTLGEVQKVLQNLLRERIPIRDLVTILETLADNARLSRDIDYLTESVRQALRRTITNLYVSEKDQLLVITLHPRLEQTLVEAVQLTSQGGYPVLEPSAARSILDQVARFSEEIAMRGLQPIVLCSSRSRLPMRRLTERSLPGLVMLGINELNPEVGVESVGTVVLP